MQLTLDLSISCCRTTGHNCLRYLKTRDISYGNDTNYVIIRLLISDLSDTNSMQAVKAALDRLTSRDHFASPFKKFKSQWLAQPNKLIQAVTLMSELKGSSQRFLVTTRSVVSGKLATTKQSTVNLLNKAD